MPDLRKTTCPSGSNAARMALDGKKLSGISVTTAEASTSFRCTSWRYNGDRQGVASDHDGDIAYGCPCRILLHQAFSLDPLPEPRQLHELRGQGDRRDACHPIARLGSVTAGLHGVASMSVIGDPTLQKLHFR